MNFCEKCGLDFVSRVAFFKHTRVDESCNLDYDNKILLLACEKIKSANNPNMIYEVTFVEPDFELYIKKCETDFYVRFLKSNQTRVAFFAEMSDCGVLIVLR